MMESPHDRSDPNVPTKDKPLYLSWIPGSSFGGAEDYASRILVEAGNRGWTTSLLAPSTQCEAEVKSRVQCVSSIRPPSVPQLHMRRLRRISECVNTFLSVKSYQSLLMRSMPSVIHAILPWHTYSKEFLIAARHANIPCLVTFQLVGPGSPPDKATYLSFRRFLGPVHRFCAISESNKSLLCEYYDLPLNDVHCIPNRPRGHRRYSSAPITLQKYDYGFNNEDILIVTVASLDPRKGHDLILDAAPALVQQFPRLHFLFIGEGELEDKLRRTSSSLYCSSHIHFLGRRHDVGQILNVCDLFLFPSRFEGESFALLEAAEARLPIIASNTSGISGTYRHEKDALLFPVNDTKTMKKMIEFALGHPQTMTAYADSAFERTSGYKEEDMMNDTFAILSKISRQ